MFRRGHPGGRFAREPASIEDHIKSDRVAALALADSTPLQGGIPDQARPPGLGPGGQFRWLRGLDLNQRPLGYEGNSSREASRSETNADKGDDDLRDYRLGRLWAASVPLLHSFFIVGRGWRSPRLAAISHLCAGPPFIWTTSAWRPEESSSESFLLPVSLSHLACWTVLLCSPRLYRGRYLFGRGNRGDFGGLRQSLSTLVLGRHRTTSPRCRPRPPSAYCHPSPVYHPPAVRAEDETAFISDGSIPVSDAVVRLPLMQRSLWIGMWRPRAGTLPSKR